MIKNLFTTLTGEKENTTEDTIHLTLKFVGDEKCEVHMKEERIGIDDILGLYTLKELIDFIQTSTEYNRRITISAHQPNVTLYYTYDDATKLFTLYHYQDDTYVAVANKMGLSGFDTNDLQELLKDYESVRLKKLDFKDNHL